MAFNKITDNLNIIQALGDEPNEDNGLTAAELKAKFDEAANTLKARINAIVDQLMAATAASDVGFSTSENVPADNVQGAIENVQAQLQAVTQGSVANGSITTAKLDGDAVTGAKVADSTLRTDVSGSSAMSLLYTTETNASNHLNLHYIRAMGMVFFEGYVQITKVLAYGTSEAVFKFDSYVPTSLASATVRGDNNNSEATFDTSDDDTVLVVKRTGVESTDVGGNVRAYVSGWYLCDGEGS